MFEVLYKTGIYSYSIDNPRGVQAGMVAMFGDNRTVVICTPESIPTGFFITDWNPWELEDPQNRRVAVAVGQGEFQTDVYERSETYKINDLLYCGSSGMVTNDGKYAGNIIVGIVNFVSGDRIGFVTCFARHLEPLSVTKRAQEPRMSRYALAMKGE